MGKINSTLPEFSCEELANILHESPVGMIISRADGSFEYVNPAMSKMLGYTGDEIYQPGLIISHQDDLKANQFLREQLLENPYRPMVMEKRYLHKNGASILGLLSMVALKCKDDQSFRFVAQIIDIEQRKKMEKSADLFRSMINASRDAMYILDPSSGKILDCNIQACESLGYPYEEMLTLHISDIEMTMSDANLWDQHVEQMRKDVHVLAYGEHRHKNGYTFPVEASVSFLIQHGFGYILAVVRDITERKKSEALIWQQANYDLLTRLPNRNMLQDRLSQAIKKAQRTSKKIAVFCLDLDKFKEVNDTLGHDMGDKLLREAGRRLINCVREVDTVARLGGDEFCVIVENVEESAHIDRVANAILGELSDPFFLGMNKVFISTSIGITFYPNDAMTAEGLLKNSDQAMYFAKNRGRNCFHYFTGSMQAKAVDRMHLSRDLHAALQKEEFYVEYQPIISLSDGAVYKAEALLRWMHPERGLVSSAEFIEIAEENGTISRIGDWVFSEVISTVKRLRANYDSTFQISVNASPLQFREGFHNIGHWHGKLLSAGLSGSAVLIEITEGLIMDTSESVTDTLLMLRDEGIQVALDDFGTGYSSLAYLQKLDIDYLKIDKSFVDNLHPGSNEEALCQAIIAMAHQLNLQVIAEGIETQQQRDLLAAAGCDFGQGYLFAKSLGLNDFERFLDERNR